MLASFIQYEYKIMYVTESFALQSIISIELYYQNGGSLYPIQICYFKMYIPQFLAPFQLTYIHHNCWQDISNTHIYLAFSNIYICIPIWGIDVSCIYILVLYISCQHLGDECKLGGFCAPFERRVGECKILELYICIGYILPTLGE